MCDHEFVHQVIRKETHVSFSSPTPTNSANIDIRKNVEEQIIIYCKKCGLKK